MKYIVKGEEPEELVAIKASDDPNWMPVYRDLFSDKKRAVHNAYPRRKRRIADH